MRKLLRLLVMTRIQHTEEYVRGAMRSKGIDSTTLTHLQISAFKATLKQIEADLMIDIAFSKGKPTRLSEVDIEPLVKETIKSA